MRFRITFILILAVKLSFAQTYNKFLDNSLWYQNVNYGWTGSVTFPYTQSFDTIINSNIYSKITSPSSSFVCAVREDTINKIVYKVFPGDTVEHKLYDFNLAVADTFSVRIIGATYPATIQQIDTISTLQGLRKRFKWRINTGILRDIYVIESVGSTDNPITIFNPILDPVYSLVCNYQNNLQIYNNTLGIVCPSLITGLIEKNKSDIILKAYPNPSNGNLRIELTKLSNYFIEIQNNVGTTIYKNEICSKELSIDINTKIGVYILKITDLNSNISEYKKVIITN